MNKWAKDFPEYVLGLASAFWPGPMTLILPRTSTAKDFITGGQDSVAIRVPSHIVAQALLKEFENRGGIGIAAPSANRFGAVSPTTADAVSSELGRYLSSDDLILDGGQCIIGIESTIIDCRQSLPIILRPGKVTQEMIEELLNIKVDLDNSVNKIKVPGRYESHYAPKAKIFLTGLPKEGDGYIALSHIPTPEGAIRLASPDDNEEFAQILYMALRSADSKGIENVVVSPPSGKGVAIAINDRLKKAAFLK
jgi:L-threonylcarbamoyladenylate synthase